MSKRKDILIKLPEKGSAFAIPLLDGRWRLAYVAQWYCTGGVKSSPLIILFDRCDIVPSNLMSGEKLPAPVGMMFTIGAKLMHGQWPIIGKVESSYAPAERALEDAIERDFMGILVHNEPIVEDFSNAIEGLVAWNKYKDPAYFDKLLVPGVARSEKAFFI